MKLSEKEYLCIKLLVMNKLAIYAIAVLTVFKLASQEEAELFIERMEVGLE